jgi:hypothetical protein
MICCGPLPLKEWVERPESALSMLGGDSGAQAQTGRPDASAADAASP